MEDEGIRVLTVETKRHIDNARDILVGKVPDPKQQIDQITNALIYKFMDDMDQQAKDAGGKASFFKGDLEQYAWHKMMNPKIGAQERLNKYTEALEKFSTAQQLPQLFRDIFRQAFLPYRDPETLDLFLKEIEYFDYNHSENLGNAFEYLLSIMGAQGDAGQFRTPRHIIDFMVEVVNPTKDDTILDPACGTAGFLISAYKHILAQHAGVDNKTGEATLEEAKLSHSDKQKLLNNLEGYDISSDMVKLARVNMYLHGNTQPKIYEYDSLTSEQRWDDNFDVILANPPFMSPKGGIRPHGKFSVESTRAEVLFVDYIATHLKLGGRAAIVIPEGIIFQSGKAYQQLRKMLVEDHYLAGVISLPAGVFNPYSGVKTSILWLDRTLAKKKKEVVFAKVENDGLSLGAQRRKIEQNDIPDITEALKLWANDTEITSPHITTVPKSKLKDSGDYNLSANRYVDADHSQNQKWPMVELGNKELFQIESGGTPSSQNEKYWNGDINWATLVDLPVENRVTPLLETRRKITDTGLQNSSAKLLPTGTVIVSSRATIGRVAIAQQPMTTNQGFKNLIIKDETKVLPAYVANVISGMTETLKNLATGGTFTEFSKSTLAKVKIPLPPIEEQRKIVAEIENKQKAIDHAREIIKSLERERRHFDPFPRAQEEGWPIVKISDVFKTASGGTPLKSNREYYENGTVPWLGSGEVSQGLLTSAKNNITEKALEETSAKLFPKDSVLVAMYGATVGQVGILGFESATNQAVCAIFPNKYKALPEYVYVVLRGARQKLVALSTGGAQPNVSQQIIKNFRIPLPPVEIQEQIVADFAREREIADANKELIDIYDQKIKSTIDKMWR